MRPVIAVILAAGKGSRMQSELPKPVVPLAGKPIVQYIIDSFEKADVHDIALIVGYKSDIVKSKIGKQYTFIEQREQKGTAHALMQAKDKIDWKGKDIFVFVGDSPLITSETISELLTYHQVANADCTFLTADFKMDLPYARVIKDNEGNLVKCVEEKNASQEELEVTELLSSHFIFNADVLFSHLDEVQADPDNGEYYLTDMLDILMNKGYKIETLHIDRYEELVGLNTPDDVAWAEELLKERNDEEG